MKKIEEKELKEAGNKRAKEIAERHYRVLKSSLFYRIFRDHFRTLAS